MNVYMCEWLCMYGFVKVLCVSGCVCLWLLLFVFVRLCRFVQLRMIVCVRV